MTSETHTEPKVNPDSLKETNAEEWQYLDEVDSWSNWLSSEGCGYALYKLFPSIYDLPPVFTLHRIDRAVNKDTGEFVEKEESLHCGYFRPIPNSIVSQNSVEEDFEDVVPAGGGGREYEQEIVGRHLKKHNIEDIQYSHTVAHQIIKFFADVAKEGNFHQVGAFTTSLNSYGWVSIPVASVFDGLIERLSEHTHLKEKSLRVDVPDDVSGAQERFRSAVESALVEFAGDEGSHRFYWEEHPDTPDNCLENCFFWTPIYFNQVIDVEHPNGGFRFGAGELKKLLLNYHNGVFTGKERMAFLYHLVNAKEGLVTQKELAAALEIDQSTFSRNVSAAEEWLERVDWTANHLR